MKLKSSLNPLAILNSSVISKHGILLMRIAIAIVYIWFGALKIFGISPAHDLVEQTCFWLPSSIFIPVLGSWEVLIGLGLLFKRLVPITVMVMLMHMLCTFLPFIVQTNLCFDTFPYRPSLVGQYIIKNLVFIAGALIVGSKSMEKQP